MKSLNLILSFLFVAAINLQAYAQTHDHSQMSKETSGTESFKVSGNCGMCKDRIEKAVKVEGVKNASWDSKTKLLSITYDPSKTSIDALSKKIAAVGHDTEKYKAPDDIYAKLPGCCRYDRVR